MPDEFDIAALLAVKSEVTTVVAAPVIVACLAFNWVCIADVTPSKYPNSVFDTEPSWIFVAAIAADVATLALVITNSELNHLF